MGDNRPYPKCHEWNERVMAKLIADHPDFVFTTPTRPWNIKPGDVMPANYIGIWQTLSDNNIPILAMRDTPWLVRNGSRTSPPTAWPTAATPSPAESSDPTYCRPITPHSISSRSSRCSSHWT